MMNIQPGLKRGNPRRSGNCATGGSFVHKLLQIGNVLLVVLAAASVAQAYVSMRQKIDAVSRENQRTRLQIKEVANELITLRNLQARYKRYDFISAQLAHFQIPLQPAEHGQIRRIIRLSPEQAARVVLPHQSSQFAANFHTQAQGR